MRDFDACEKERLLQVNKIEMLNIVRFHVYFSFTFLVFFLFYRELHSNNKNSDSVGGRSVFLFFTSRHKKGVLKMEFTLPVVNAS